MNIDRLRTLPLPLRLGIPIVTVGLAAAACGSSGSSQTTPAAAAPSSSATSSSAPAAAGGGITLEMHTGGPGTYLTNAAGRSVYLFASDTANMSTCSGACATAWPPLTTTSAAKAGSGVTASEIGTITRSDGTKQVTYNHHPLYYFLEDSAPGQTNGQGSTAFGAKWWLVTPAGASLTSTGGAPSAAPMSSSGGGGYSY
jgi:predicted lipoprotein with Yx(FWY)xxD motif